MQEASVEAQGSSPGKKRALHALTVILLLFFISGVTNQSIAFGLPQKAHHSELWHLFHLVVGLLCIFAVLAKKELGYWWILTVFLWQIPVETYGAYYVLSHGLDELSQIIEPFLNVGGLVITIATRARYLRRGDAGQGRYALMGLRESNCSASAPSSS